MSDMMINEKYLIANRNHYPTTEQIIVEVFQTFT